MSDGVWAGLDIGGSKVHGVALDDEGTVLGQVRLRSAQGADGVVATASLALARLRALPAVADRPLLGVGAGVPGVVDAGHVSHAVNLGLGADRLALRDGIAATAGCPVVVENDVNAAALGAWHALGTDVSDLAYLSIGTGLAAGVVLGGRLRRGTRGAAGEIGHVPMDPAGPACPCGQRGCLEVLASGTAISRRWPVPDGGNAAFSLFDAADGGDPEASRIRDEVADHLAAAVRLLVLTLDVELVVLGGGVADVGTRLRKAVSAALVRQQQGAPFLRALDLAARVVLPAGGRPLGAVGAALAGRAWTHDDVVAAPIGS
ncbi:MAG TPA: ROK family protein [Actinomycetales bacterium]|nr:ROK family protein [Actinomycetales bacterium]